MIINKDCLEALRELPDNSIDSIVTDPPYGLSFMGKKWDYDVPSVEIWQECLRVLKPGGYLLAFAGTRTQHRMAVRIEDAGFEIRDMIAWIYGSGFPKSRNIGLDVDKRNGVTKNRGKAFVVAGQSGQRDKDTGGDLVPGSNTMGAYIAQNEWSGWGTALKPAHEPICMARKPLSESTVAENCLKWGTGGINIDESRVEYTSEKDKKEGQSSRPNSTSKGMEFYAEGEDNDFNRSDRSDITGRFPANLIHDGSDEVKECFPNESERFFKSIIYQAKASKRERNMGCEGLEKGCTHPTVKPVALMEYLVKLISKEGHIVLDPFMGSGTTGIACKKLNRKFIGIERDEEYCKIAEARINNVDTKVK